MTELRIHSIETQQHNYSNNNLKTYDLNMMINSICIPPQSTNLGFMLPFKTRDTFQILYPKPKVLHFDNNTPNIPKREGERERERTWREKRKWVRTKRPQRESSDNLPITPDL